jgi:hypothetical protein
MNPLIFSFFVACRPDAGAPSYPSAEDLPNWGGPDPYEEGEERISLGIFYELGASEAYTIDNTNQFFYIWSNTFSVFATDERIEGYSADRIVVGTIGWWGGGIFWSEEGDFSDWTTLHVSLKSEDENITAIEVGMGQGDGEILHWFPVAEYGFSSDNEWHHLSIPLAPAWDFIDPTRIQMPFNIRGNGPENSEILIDNLYISKGDTQ